MTKIAILPIAGDQGEVHYCAVANGKHSQGATAGAALDAITEQLTPEESGTLIIVQNQQPDRFFNEAQLRRLGELMAKWRRCRDEAKALPAEDEAELKLLVDAELRASGARAAALADELKR